MKLRLKKTYFQWSSTFLAQVSAQSTLITLRWLNSFWLSKPNSPIAHSRTHLLSPVTIVAKLSVWHLQPILVESNWSQSCTTGLVWLTKASRLLARSWKRSSKPLMMIIQLYPYTIALLIIYPMINKTKATVLCRLSSLQMVIWLLPQAATWKFSNLKVNQISLNFTPHRKRLRIKFTWM